MGTNYYWIESKCEHCGAVKEDKKHHIGKSSAGWCFSLNTHEELGIRSLSDWVAKWATGGHIEDEYGSTISMSEMIETIAERFGGIGSSRDPKFYVENSAQEGPNGLLRHRIDDRLCIGHGAGTWDIMRGEFS